MEAVILPPWCLFPLRNPSRSALLLTEMPLAALHCGFDKCFCPSVCPENILLLSESVQKYLVRLSNRLFGALASHFLPKKAKRRHNRCVYIDISSTLASWLEFCEKNIHFCGISVVV
jgi:hypothetical protein